MATQSGQDLATMKQIKRQNPADKTAPYGIAILTFNEELALPGLLESIPRDVPVILVDSGSSDQTVAIAKAWGATVELNTFTGFGDQRNFAIGAAGDAPEWQLHLDADERMTPRLDEEVRKVTQQESAVDAYAIPNRLLLHGKWIRRSSGYPVYQVRLVRRSVARFENYGHGQQEAPGTRVAKLMQPYIHDAFINGMTSWLAKHNNYADREIEVELSGATRVKFRDLIGADSIKRRRAARDLCRKLPFKGALQCFRVLILKAGILDGWQGIAYARMLSVYEGMKQVKRDEARSKSFTHR